MNKRDFFKDKCDVKGCNRRTGYLYITHENNGGKFMCEDCVDKYLRGEVAESSPGDTT